MYSLNGSISPEYQCSIDIEKNGSISTEGGDISTESQHSVDIENDWYISPEYQGSVDFEKYLVSYN